MPLNENEKQEFLAEALDSQKVTLYCKDHMYFGPSKEKPMAPHLGCPQCWMVFYFHDMAQTAPHLREQRMEELTEVLHKVVEEVQRGTWDYKPYDKAKFEFESN